MLDSVQRAPASATAGHRPVSLAGDRRALARLVIVLLAALLGATFLFSLASGASDASAWTVLLELTGMAQEGALSARDRIIVMDIRLPRAVLGVLIGAARPRMQQDRPGETPHAAVDCARRGRFSASRRQSSRSTEPSLRLPKNWMIIRPAAS